MGNYQSEIDQMKKDAMEREEALELWTQEQNKARDKEDREREARHKKEFEELARRTENQIKQMGIDMKRREDERARAKEEKTKKEKAEELAIRKEKERLEQIRAEEEEEKRLRKIKKLRTEIKEMKPGESFEFPLKDITFPKRLNIGVFGTTGVGKTSLINSLKFAVNGVLEESQREQAAPASFQGGHTTRRLAVRITQYLTFVDNRGVGAEDLVKDGAAEEIIRQMEGRSSFASEVDWGKSSRPDDMEVDETKKIYCTVLVFNAQSIVAVQTVVRNLVEHILKWQGRFPLGVITHVDDASPEELDKMRLALMMGGIVDVYEVANITDKNKKLEPMYQENLLKLLHKCIKDGDRIFELRNEIELEEKKRETRKKKLGH